MVVLVLEVLSFSTWPTWPSWRFPFCNNPMHCGLEFCSCNTLESCVKASNQDTCSPIPPVAWYP
ncbi:hypothetical protein LINPERHAP2_LOCUS19794 [Linum perenne]